MKKKLYLKLHMQYTCNFINIHIYEKRQKPLLTLYIWIVEFRAVFFSYFPDFPSCLEWENLFL